MKDFLILSGLILATFSVFSQVREFKITDSNGNPVPGVYVKSVSGSGKAITDEQGNFSWPVVSREEKIRFSHVSYDEAEVSVAQLLENNGLELDDKYYLASQVTVTATRADDITPATYIELNEAEIAEVNFGQDMPYLLDLTPSVTVNSDAGAGIGYTGMRIRGSDITRINVTVNGIPLNDSESHGVFWVNTPDLASSTESIQLQRGVGTSTNGSGAFGANLNLQTGAFSQRPEIYWSGAAGSFGTFRNTLKLGTGLIDDKWYAGGRMSTIISEGYIDRASSDLSSWYLEGGFVGEKTIIKALGFGGHERTYQSWWGTPESRLENDIEGMEQVAINNGYTEEQRQNLLNSGRTFNYYLYENEVDDYGQDHYQLHIHHTFSSLFSANIALHHTKGQGYFEQFREDDAMADYDITPINTTEGLIESTDLVRRRWLDNTFSGITYSFTSDRDKLDMVLGGAYNRYNGKHFGEVIWAEYAQGIAKDHRYYDNDALKTDFNVYLKSTYHVSDKLYLFGDLQLREIGYEASGPDNERDSGIPIIIDLNERFTFFNPKFGVSARTSQNGRLYLSYARSSREPVRSDFIDNRLAGRSPVAETLDNIESGWEGTISKLGISTNLFFMKYTDQLVLTGRLNDVGAAIRENVPDSYRAGIETSMNLKISSKWSLNGNISLSRNKIKEYREVIYDYGVDWSGFEIIETIYKNTDLSFSPNIIAASTLEHSPVSWAKIALISKYVGRQYLDNTQNTNRSINPFFVNALRASFAPQIRHSEKVTVGLLVNNIFDVEYEANGYTFGYRGGGEEIRENYYYPQAGRNFLLSLTILF